MSDSEIQVPFRGPIAQLLGENDYLESAVRRSRHINRAILWFERWWSTELTLIEWGVLEANDQEIWFVEE